MSATVLEVLHLSEAADRSKWEQLVSQSPLSDIYYRPAYVLANQIAGQGEGICLVIGIGGKTILFPLMLRPISLPLACEQGLMDAVTPYGYGGLLTLSPQETFEAADLGAAISAFRAWCFESQIVSVLLRLHPVREQPKWIAACGDGGITLRMHGPTTAIDVQKWDDTGRRPMEMKSRRRTYLNSARRKLHTTCVTGIEVRSPSATVDHIAIFQNIYEQTMDRLKSQSYYYFPRAYYEAMATGLADKMAVITAWHGDQAVGSAMIFSGDQLGHYHLGGATEEGRDLRASTLVLTEGAAWARDKGCSLMHLGGGTAGDDSLYHFKRSFGGPEFAYAFCTCITNADAYKSLVDQNTASEQPLRVGFFPEYRA